MRFPRSVTVADTMTRIFKQRRQGETLDLADIPLLQRKNYVCSEILEQLEIL